MKIIRVNWVNDDNMKESELFYHSDSDATVPDEDLFKDDYHLHPAFEALTKLGWKPVEDFTIGKDNWMF